MSSIKAVTFDLWDTLIVDDSDEPIRAERRLPSKKEARRRLVLDALDAAGLGLDPAIVRAAYDAVDVAYGKVWHEQHVTWTVAERLDVLLRGLSRDLPASAFEELVRQHEDMELDPSPRFADGAAEVVRELAGRYRLGVISDTIFSPGRAMRQLLDRAGIGDCFDAFVFSDEVGSSKPVARLFHLAARELGVDISELAHIGDREHNDVGGAHAAGAKAVLITVIKDRRAEAAPTRAEGVCTSYDELASVLESLCA